jgi:signal transduction histidine kinase
MMNIIQEIASLSGMRPDKQLEKIKEIKTLATKEELAELLNIAETVNPPWIRNALLNIVKQRSNETAPKETTKSQEIRTTEDEAYDLDALKSEAIAESIGQIIHELDPVVGSLDVIARREVVDFENSEIKDELERLVELLDTFSEWQKAEQSPKYKEINIYELVNAEVERFRPKSKVDFTVNISSTLTFELDKSLTLFVISNALRNAVESSNIETLRIKNPILIIAGVTDSDFWLTVIDDGLGLQADQEVLYKSHYTTKAGNRGLGLTVVGKAIASMKGSWKLSNSTPSGAQFHFNIPKRKS